MGSKSKMPAARIGDVDTGHPPAPPTPVITGSPNVLINGRPAARVNDMLIPHHPGVRLIKEGSNSVLINGQPAARVTDGINCGGVLVTGSSNVFIGDNPKPPRNQVSELEFNAYMEASFKPENTRLDPKGLVELAAITAIPYRGEAGAVATWHEYYMGNDPDPGDLDDPLKAQGYAKAQQEKADTAAEQAQLAALSQPQQAAEAASAPLQAALDGVDPEAPTDSVITNHATTMMEAASTALDVTPVIGSLKSAGQLISGSDLVTCEPLSRGMELAGIVAGVIPGGKGILKGGSKISEFIGKLRGKVVSLPGVTTKTIQYTKRSREELLKLRREFDGKARPDFIKSLAGDPDKLSQLKNAGISDEQISKMLGGGVPKGWQVHHKIPLDDGGTNKTDNLIMIKTDPGHLVLTNAQNDLTKGMKVGETRQIDFPVPDGFIYPP